MQFEYFPHICICPALPQWKECDTRLNFKQSKAGLNSGFSFSNTGCLNQAPQTR